MHQFSISWSDDSGYNHDIILKDALFFPDSPVNVVSVIRLADHFEDDEGTYIMTRRRTSEFVWDHFKFKKTFDHPSSRLPEMLFNEGNKRFNAFSTIITRAMSFTRNALFATSTTVLPNNFDI